MCLQNLSSINTSLMLLGIDLIVNRIHEIGDEIDRIRASNTATREQQQSSSATTVVGANSQRHQIVQRVLHLVETTSS